MGSILNNAYVTVEFEAHETTVIEETLPLSKSGSEKISRSVLVEVIVFLKSGGVVSTLHRLDTEKSTTLNNVKGSSMGLKLDCKDLAFQLERLIKDL